MARARAEAALPPLLSRVAALEAEVAKGERLRLSLGAQLADWRMRGASARRVEEEGREAVTGGLPVLVGNLIKRQRKG